VIDVNASTGFDSYIYIFISLVTAHNNFACSVDAHYSIGMVGNDISPLLGMLISK